MRIPATWHKPLAEERLLLLSPFGEKQRRATADTAAIRNEFVATLADKIFIAHSAHESKTEHFCRNLVATGKQILTLDGNHNANLISMGAHSIFYKNKLRLD